MPRKPGQPSVKAVNLVSSVRPTASRFRLISVLMSVFALATAAKTRYSSGLRVDIADTHLDKPLRALATSDEGRIQSQHDRWRRYFRPDRGGLTNCLTNFQGMTPHGLGVPRGVHRKQLLQKIGSRSVGHQRAEVRLQPIQFRCRPAMQWPVEARLAHRACGTAKAGKPCPNLAEKRGDQVVLIVFDATATATT